MVGETPRQEEEQVLEPKFEKIQQALDVQAEQIRQEAEQKGYSGILTNLAEKGRKIVGITLLSILPAIAAGCSNKQESVRPDEAKITQGFKSILGLEATAEKDGSFIVKGKGKNAFKVSADSLDKMEKIRKDYEASINKAKGSKKARLLMEGKKELMKIVRGGEKVAQTKFHVILKKKK